MYRALNPRGEKGTVLAISLVLTVALVVAAAAFLTLTSTEVVQVKRNIASVRAFYYAEAGINYAQAQILRGWQLASFASPFHFLDYNTITTLPADKALKTGTPDEGEFHVEIMDVTTPYQDARDVTVKSTGTYRGEERTVMAVFCLELAPSRVFDYTYFLNHWGWTEGIPSAFKMNGNIRANGYFSFSNSSLYENGNPEYKWVRGQKQYKDSGGIYSGFRITGASSLNGMGKLDVNQHMKEDLNGNSLLDPGEDHNQDGKLTNPEHVEMPNLTEMALYEDYAKSWNGGAGSSITIQGAGPGGTDLLVSDAVYGDGADEKGNLVLWGTEDNPVVVDGPVVIRGALIIKGCVKGKGSLYVQDNVYIPDNVTYVNAPEGKPNWDYFAYSDPLERYETWTAAASQWRQQNADKDGLGLFARENLIIGDFQDGSWRGLVNSWLNNSANESAERANGLDHMPNTGDEGEGDSKWTVDYYTQEDLDAGLIPPGKGVGDVVPGSGEDIDGDGCQDDRININDFQLPAALKKANWGGWTPPEIEWPPSGINYGQFLNANGGACLDHIDALLYTNHATVGAWGKNSPQIHLLGGIVSRIEAIILRNNGSADWTHDERFTGGGQEFGFLLPRVKMPIKVVHWGEVPENYELNGS
jgi:hypothetical protein